MAVSIEIYLSTMARLKADPTDYDSTFPSSSRPFTDNTEKGSYRIPLGWTYGDTARTNTFGVTYSGEPYFIEVIQAYDAIKVVKTEGNTSEVVFLGCKPTYRRTIDKADWISVQASYSDYSADFSSVLFNSSDEWEQSIIASNGYKVCDPTDTSHSMVHYLFSLLNTDSLLSLVCTYSDTTIVEYMQFKGRQSVLSVFARFLSQNGLAYYVDKDTVYIVDVLEEKTGTATTVDDIESNGRIEQKPYIKRTVPYIRRPTVTTFNDKEVYNSGYYFNNFSVTGWYPTGGGGASGFPEWCTADCRYTDIGENQTVATYANRVYRFEPDYTDCPTLYFKHEGHESGGTTVYPAHNGSQSGNVPSNSIEYKCHLITGYKTGGFRLTIRADVVCLDYNQITKVPAGQWDGTEERAEYVFSENGGMRYTKALMYAKDIEAKKYHFYTNQKLAIDSLVVIRNVTTQSEIQAGEFIRIVTREDNLDEFGGYTYTGVPYKSTTVTTDEQFLGVTHNPPDSFYDFELYATPSYVLTTPDSVPRANQSVRITIALKEYIGTPTLKVNGETVTPTRDTDPTDSTKYLNSYSYVYDIPRTAIGDSIPVEATLESNTKAIAIAKFLQAESVKPEIIVPTSYAKVTQYCYIGEDGPLGYVEDADDILEDNSYIVADTIWEDEVNGECPLSPKMGYYIWRREGVYNPNTETAPSSWTYSMYDTPYYRFDFSVSQFTYVKNDRSVQTNENVIYFTPNIVGLSTTTLVLTASNGLGVLPFDSENQRFTLTFGAKNAPAGKITVEAVLGALKWSCYLTCDDQTEHNIYNGILATEPSSPLVGDSYVDSTADYAVKVYTDDGWKLLSQSGMPLALLSEICGKAQKDVLSNIPTGSVEQSDYGYFNVIIAGMITADYVKALQGVFENIAVSGSISADHSYVYAGVFNRDRFYPEWF